MVEETSERQTVYRVELVSKERSLVDKVSSYTPLFISLLALSLSIWSAYATRLHNRLTVRPIVTIGHDLVGPATDRVGISLKNDGFAPAAISDVALYLDGRRLKNWEPVQDVLRAFPEPRIKTRWRWLPANAALRPGEVKYLYSAESSDISEENPKLFNDVLRTRLTLFVKACSAYEECELMCLTSTSASCEDEQRRLTTVAR